VRSEDFGRKFLERLIIKVDLESLDKRRSVLEFKDRCSSRRIPNSL
jgi:hypothetical protein